MASPLGVALIGTGRIGTVHLQDALISQRLQILWLVDLDTARAKDVHRRFQLSDDVRIASVNDVDDVYNDVRVNCVLVCTPTETHEQIVKRALSAGKAVFCEKPLAASLQGIRECYDLAKEKDLPIFCAFNRRYDPQFRSVHDRLRSGEIGQLRVVKTTSRDPPAVADLSLVNSKFPIFTESGIHDIDVICWLTGEAPSTVYATGQATDPEFKKIGELDTICVTLTFSGGVIGNIEISWFNPMGYDQRVEVLGTKGMLQVVNEGPAMAVQHTDKGTILPPIHQGFVERYAMAYKLELEHFIDIVEGKTAPEVTAESTLTAHTVAAACKESYHTGQPIQMDEFIAEPVMNGAMP